MQVYFISHKKFKSPLFFSFSSTVIDRLYFLLRYVFPDEKIRRSSLDLDSRSIDKLRLYSYVSFLDNNWSPILFIRPIVFRLISKHLF